MGPIRIYVCVLLYFCFARFGVMSADVLSWLRGEEAFDPQSAVHKRMELSFAGERSPKRRIEENRKIFISGSLGGRSFGSMCGLSLAKPLPLPRFQAWFQAFLKANAGTISKMDGRAKAAVAPDSRSS